MTRQIAIGDRIYWDGDMANQPKEGTVLAVGFHVQVEWDNDGGTAYVSKRTFGGPRWGFIEDRESRRNVMLADFERRYGTKAGCIIGVEA